MVHKLHMAEEEDITTQGCPYNLTQTCIIPEQAIYPESDGYTKINPLPTVTSALAMATPEAPFGVHSSSPVGSCTISDMTAAFWWCNGSQAI